jgi:hypothetical protein
MDQVFNPDGSVTLRQIPYDTQSDRLSANMAYNIYFFSIKGNLKISTDLSYSQLDRLQNSLPIQMQNYTTGLTTEFSAEPLSRLHFNLKLQGMQLYSASEQANRNHRSQMQLWTGQGEITYHLTPSMYLQASHDLNHFYSKNNAATALFGDYKLNYAFKRFDLGLLLLNSYNQQSYTLQSLTLNRFSTQTYQLRPRALMLTTRFIL